MLAGGGQVFRAATSNQDVTDRGEEQSDVLQGESDGSQLSYQQADEAEVRHDFWSFSRNHVYRHHFQPRVKLLMPSEGFPIPLKSIAVVRRTNATLDVLLERRTDDQRNVDGGRELSGPWTSFTQFTILSGRPPNGYTWSGGAVDKKSRNIQARSLVKYVEKISTKRRTALGFLL